MSIWNSYFTSLNEKFLPYWNKFFSAFLNNSPIPRALVGLCLLSFVLFIIRRFFFYDR